MFPIRQRGQVTAFMIMGLLILLLVGLFYVQQEKQVPSSLQPQREYRVAETKTVQNFVQQCLEKTAWEGLAKVLSQGGYYEVPGIVKAHHDNLAGIEIPYYFYQGTMTMPPLEFIGQETGKAISAAMKNCVSEFTAFKNQGLRITQKEPVTTVMFLPRETRVELVFPVSITDGTTTTEIYLFSTMLPFSFKEKYEEVFSYMLQQQEAPNEFLIGKISSLARKHKHGFGFKQEGQTGDTIVLDFSYDAPAIEIGRKLVYQFSLKFGWDDLLERVTQHEPQPSPLVLERIPVWNITQAGEHTLQLRARGEDLTFAIQPENGPELNPSTGLLKLDTASFPDDEYLYYVEVTDNHGYRVLAPLIIDVRVGETTGERT